MRIKRLELKAFGPFSERTLDFSSRLPGLHVVYGPNEAGKSSSLRALQALLFGFPVRTNDDFLHRYEQLLVGGCLQASDGQELCFWRRKKNKNSLFDLQDKPLEQAALSPFLHGLEQNVFTALYGIDHETLVKGGQGILDQQGEAGQSLFAAGAGLASLKAIVDDLELEGDSLFRPRGSSQALTLALNQYKELQGQIKLVTLSSRDWLERQRALEEAEQKLEAANLLRGQVTREKRQLERLKQALPYLGQRRSLLGRLAELGEVVELPADFAERRRRLEQLMREARSRHDYATGRIRVLQERSKGISLNQGMLDHASAIEELHQGLGQYRKNKIDCPQRDGLRIGCRIEAANLLRQIRPGMSLEEVEKLRPGLAKRRAIQLLGARHEAVGQRQRQTGQLVRSIVKELDKVHHELRKVTLAGDVEMLARAVTLARKVGDLDGEIALKRQNLARANKECQAALNRLGLWSGQLAMVEQLPLPLPETLQRLEEEFHQLSEKKGQLAGDRLQLENELSQLGEQLGDIADGAEVPTADDLSQFRSRRDGGWQLLRRQWLQGENVAAESLAYDPERSLPEAYERLVGLADQAADRLYREADRVQKHASLKARIGRIERRLAELGEKEGYNESLWLAATRRWQELWAPCGITPLSPREMHAWLNGFDKLRFQVGESARITIQADVQVARRGELRTLLLKELAAFGELPDFPGEELAPLLQFAEALVERVQSAQAQRELHTGKSRDLEKALVVAQLEHAEAEEDCRQWQLQWHEAIVPLGIGDQVLPAEVLDFIEVLQGCFDKLQEADNLRKRIEGMERDDREFEAKIRTLVNVVSPDLLANDVPLAVIQLKNRLGMASQEQAVLQQDAEEINALEKAISTAAIEIADITEQMTMLRLLAGCQTEELLNEAERRSSEYLKIRDKLAEVEEALARIAEGVALTDLEGQAQGLDPDELPGRISALTAEVEGRLDPEIRQLSETIGREKSELARMNGTGKAAELAEGSQQLLARIRRLSERYIRIKLASRILRDEIERYRAENQDPVLTIAARYFRELTLGSLVGLRTDIDEQGQPVLVGVRANGNWLPVAGMSSGTRDQLYLALRLASLEWRLQTSEAMPFIVDDILVNFDDRRSQATLMALAGLAEKTQVILFTHQDLVFQAAQALQDSGRVFTHQL